MSDSCARKAEDASHKLLEALGRVYSQLSDSGSKNRPGSESGEDVDGSVDRSSVRTAVGQLEELVDKLRSAYEEYIQKLEHDHTQYKADAEHREQSNTKLLQDYVSENEKLVERNLSLQQEMNALQTRYRTAEASLKEKESTVISLTEQLGVHREDHRRASTTYESRVREVGEQVEEWKWRVKEEEKEKQEKDRELAQCRDMERTLRTTLEDCQHQLQNTLQELHKTKQELHSADVNLASTTEELSAVRHKLQPKEEELEALQEKISDRAQQLMELLDRRSGDYSRQVQEEILAQSRAYDEVLKKFARTGNSSTTEDTLLASHSIEMITRLRDFLNPHSLSSHTSLDHDIATSYQRYINTFTDFTQRVRVGEFIACPKSKVRLHRLQQWRHHYKEVLLKPAPGLKIGECPLCDVISLMKGVAEKLAVAPNSLLLYTVEKTRIGGTTIRLWVLRRALASTVQYEADSLLADLSLGGHRITFVSLSEPLGAPTPLEQWEAAHHRVVGRLEESPMTDVVTGGGGGGGGGGERTRADSLEMIDLDPSQPTSQLISSGSEGGRDAENGHVTGGRNRHVVRRAGFHLRALMGLLCCSCYTGGHGNRNITHYQHLQEMHTGNHSDVT